MALTDRHREWSTLAIRLLTELLLLRTLRLKDRLVLSAEERYLKVLREESALVRLISQRDLAQYLGVTPEALSRIAARARERQRLQPAGE
jgi:CRP-like cAMP-binding protein